MAKPLGNPHFLGSVVRGSKFDANTYGWRVNLSQNHQTHIFGNLVAKVGTGKLAELSGNWAEGNSGIRDVFTGFMTGQAVTPNLHRGVLQIVLIYVVFATLWILFSDWGVAALVTDPDWLLKVNIAKGWVFVGFTALLLYGQLLLLVRRLDKANFLKNEVQAQLRQRNEELEALMDSLPTPVFIAQDAACSRITGNRAANEFFGVTAQTNVSASAEASSKSLGYRVFEAVGGRELESEELPMQRAAISGQPVMGIDCYLRLADGKGYWLLGNAIPLFDAEGQVRGAVGVFADITERKEAQRSLETYKDELEIAVAARTNELVRANDQLKAFTYAASHDLKAPLRGISGFSKLLASSCQERLESKELHFLDHIQASAARMATLIDDLLAYAQQEQKRLSIAPVNLANAVSQILCERHDEIRRCAAQVQVALPEVTVQADPSGFAQVLRNLLDNALKYAAQANPPRLEIGGEVMDEQCRLWFRDNGIGFDMAYHERIFEIFQRLHPYSDIPGSGVGLALVRKAMDRMDGKVWAESTPGKGSTFFLELKVTSDSGT